MLFRSTFFFENVGAVRGFAQWIDDHFAKLKQAAEFTTRHGKLNRVKCYQIGRQVVVNFGFYSADAQGMNMIVKATERAAAWLVANTGAIDQAAAEVARLTAALDEARAQADAAEAAGIIASRNGSATAAPMLPRRKVRRLRCFLVINMITPSLTWCAFGMARYL